MRRRVRQKLRPLLGALPAVALFSAAGFAAEGPGQTCEFTTPAGEFAIHECLTHPDLSTDPGEACWRAAAWTTITKACGRQLEYPGLKTTVRAFWTKEDLFVLFECPYTELNLFTPPDHSKARPGLWDRDVVEMFAGGDWANIRHYREFEIAPTGDWIDLAIDLDRRNGDQSWHSGWMTEARIDEAHKVWYASARIPLRAISGKAPEAGTRWRLNFYRIDGPGPDPERHFLCWQRTCGSNHVPEHFGTLVFKR